MASIPILEENVGIPPDPWVWRSAYPFQRMVVGDWFDVPLDRINPIRAMASNYGKRCGARFKVREVDGKARVKCIALRPSD